MKTNTILDTRDLQKRLNELTELRDAVKEATEARDELVKDDSPPDSIEDANQAVDDAESDFGDDEKEELNELEEIESEVPDFRHGATLINRDRFTEYCKEMLADIGDLPKDLPRYIVIDWDATADNIEADYSEIEYQGETYLYRQ